MKQPKRDLLERLEGAAQACHAAMILSCEATCREAADEIRRLRSGSSESGAITDNDKRWRILEHGCQWVSWTPKGGETVSFDPRDVKYLKAMRASADATIEQHVAILRAGAEEMERRLKR